MQHYKYRGSLTDTSKPRRCSKAVLTESGKGCTVIANLCSKTFGTEGHSFVLRPSSGRRGTWPTSSFHDRRVLLSEVLLPDFKCTAIVRGGPGVKREGLTPKLDFRLGWWVEGTALRILFQSRSCCKISTRSGRVFHSRRVRMQLRCSLCAIKAGGLNRR